MIKHNKVTISVNQNLVTEDDSVSDKEEIPQNLRKPEVLYHFRRSSNLFLLSAR